MDEAVFHSVCVPLLSVNHTALLAISTPDDEFNFYSELFNLKTPTGESLFELLSIGLACETCMENGLVCNHKLDRLPAWKSVERQELVQSILGQNRDLADRETRGVVKSGRREVFEKPWIIDLTKVICVCSLYISIAVNMFVCACVYMTIMEIIENFVELTLTPCDEFIQRPSYEWSNKPNVLFTAIDPAGNSYVLTHSLHFLN